ncbi:MAG: Uma2 family endonuclease [Nitrospirae bacterium]|nr:MAG: Uma2 family endonuclease [Nitrospirota bacterium]
MTPQAASKKNSSVKFTYEDYLLFPDDGKRHELIDGEHYMTPAPSTRHQRVSLNLSTLVQNFLMQKKIGTLYTAPCDVVLSDLDVVQPDLLFISAARASIITEKHIQGAPDLIVEIVSETTRKTDEIIKRKLYARHGVPEYWIVDPELETVKVYRMAEQGYVRTAELSREAGDMLSTPLLPGLQIPLSEVFA